MHKKSLVEKMFKNKSEGTIKNYQSTVRNYEEFHNMTIDELVKEALEEQTNRVPEHELKVYDRLMDFQDHLINDKGYVYKTIILHVTRIKTKYKRSRVTLPYFPPLDAKHIKRNDYIEYHQVISKDEIRLALPYFKPNFQARIMIMATGGYSLEETRTLTIRQFLEELYPYHQQQDPKEAMRILSLKDNIIWVAKMLRMKTQKPYYGMCNPETTQAIAKSWVDKDFDIDSALFPQNKTWVSNHMGHINDLLGFGKAGGFRRFTPHTLRRYNATNLSGADLTYEEQMQVKMIDELQGRSMTDTQDRYIKTNPIKQKLMYAKVMNNVSLFNEYTYEIFDGDVVVHRVDPQKKIRKLSDENKLLKKEVENQHNADMELKKYIQSVGKDTFEERLSKLLSEL